DFTLDGVYSDVSDASFSYQPQVAGIDVVTTGLGGLSLSGVYPNPFATETEVRWLQTASGSMTLRMYNQTGTLVSEQSLGHLNAGANTARINAALLPAGVYIYELRSSLASVRGTMMIVR
ncbi:MAG: T9SS type A sorting domain-containing protein, partial [bacterium]|nr:T9SS type A sorting domain-containing protein [Candidatus Kapabacteria bacterium]